MDEAELKAIEERTAHERPIARWLAAPPDRPPGPGEGGYFVVDDVPASAREDVPALAAEVRRLRDVLELIETAVVDGRANLDVWDIMTIATNALAGKEDVLG